MLKDRIQISIPVNEVLTIDNGGVLIPEPGIYEIEIWLEDADTVNQTYDEL